MEGHTRSISTCRCDSKYELCKKKKCTAANDNTPVMFEKDNNVRQITSPNNITERNETDFSD